MWYIVTGGPFFSVWAVRLPLHISLSTFAAGPNQSLATLSEWVLLFATLVDLSCIKSRLFPAEPFLLSFDVGQQLAAQPLDRVYFLPVASLGGATYVTLSSAYIRVIKIV